MRPIAAATISQRALNRATLARQMLLVRETLPTVQAVERLAGMQSQLARPPFVGLWSRLEGFRREDLLKALHARTIVRVTAMRATLHLLSAADYVEFRGTLHPMLTRSLRSIFKASIDGVDLDADRRERAAISRCDAGHIRRPARPPRDAPSRNQSAAARICHPHAGAARPGARVRRVRISRRRAILPRPTPGSARPIDVENGAPIETLVRRYLAAFGPATPADAQTWSGLQGLRGVFDAMRPSLVTFRTEDNRELFDLPDAPRPGEDAEAPVRFLPEFDNLVMAYADRRRLVADEHRPRLITKNLQVPATFLVDGRIAGTWRIERKGKAATVMMEPFEKLKPAARAALTKEGRALLQFAEPEASELRVTQP